MRSVISVSQDFDINHLLYRLRRQDYGAVLIHTYAILDPHCQTPEMSRPPLIIRYVDAWLNRHAVSVHQRHRPSISRYIVHVQANIVTYMVWEELAYCVATAQTQIEAEGAKLFSQSGLSGAVDPIQADLCGRAAQGNTAALDPQDRLIQITLRGGETARDGPSAGDIGDVEAVLAAGIDENGLFGGESCRVVHIVNHTAAGTAGDDGNVGGAVKAVLAEFVGEEGLKVLFEGPGAAHRGG